MADDEDSIDWPTSAAGRHGERMAADTAATVRDPEMELAYEYGEAAELIDARQARWLAKQAVKTADEAKIEIYDDVPAPELKPFPEEPVARLPTEADLGIGTQDAPLVAVAENPEPMVADEPAIELKPFPDEAFTDDPPQPAVEDESWFSE